MQSSFPSKSKQYGPASKLAPNAVETLAPNFASGHNILPFYQRLWIYCQERFPLGSYGLMTVVFCLAGLTLSRALRMQGSHIAASSFGIAASSFGSATSSFGNMVNSSALAAVASVFALFFILRVADEHKDSANDAQYLPSRPVPRGLVTLGELRAVAIVLGAVQFVASASAGPVVLSILLATWAYLFCMSKEFFCSTFLRTRPLLYMFTHMFIMLFCDLLITSFDFVHGVFDLRLLYFFAASFANGIVIELGRKICAAGLESPGMTSYSRLFGLPGSLAFFGSSVVISQAMLVLCLHGLDRGVLPSAAFLLADLIFVLLVCRALKLGGAYIQHTVSKVANYSVLICYFTVLISSFNY